MTTPLPIGSTIGILGGGQLGRMTALAAATLGYKCHIYDPQAGGPASQVAAAVTVADWDDAAALAAFAESVDVVWGLQLMLQLVDARGLEADVAISIAEAVHASNPTHITPAVLGEFKKKIAK